MEQGKRIAVDLVQQSDHPDVADTFARLKAKPIGIVNIHRTLANSPAVFDRFIALAHALRFETELDPGERELAILCVLERHQGDYELDKHRMIARAAGVSEAKIAHVRAPDAQPSLFSDRERAILTFAEQFAADPGERPAHVETAIEAHLDNRQRIELGLTLALYLGLAHFTALLDVPED
ncbi:MULTISPECIES: carboxymuconolactone decarboxylase family protein [unclassified Sphingomonas]|uniref:carboxymuconolactone decarboxylase family protein n=1 Tax=unclassified Sphingomonas TaxID=196159 RepID=UPI0006FA9446|nr:MULTISPECIES: carboxymuconolactone decarboxylase family protein [unclassified Sphingomonas]KQX23259.1 hypothetical protein ASD17_02755 [Sphingomonas sp. Root1294]KQY68107.1 hypothetical protein ASD39_05275 [Sphingomonas sp. Root50]KRB90999.1 hypothetical protein ASE22_12075 [Sphingomonas sp. Root720]